MLFFVSLLLLAWSSMRLASHFATAAADRYWIFVGSAMLQVGAITSITSLVHHLTPVGWLLVQLLFGAATVLATGGLRWPISLSFLGSWKAWRAQLTVVLSGLSLWGTLALLTICTVLLISLALQVALPIENFDDRMYHASRVIYWIQHRSVFPFETHNLRQTIIPFGSELFFLWPVLLTKTELVGRLVFWLALPLAALGQYFLLRAMKLGQTVALVGALILLTTPRVTLSAVGLRPEIWSIVALLGLAYWAVSLCSGAEGGKMRCFFLGVFAILSINVRSFPVAVLPSILLIVWWGSRQLPFLQRLKALLAGVALAGVLSSLLIPLVFNTVLYRHPMGPPEVQQVVRAEVSPQTMYTHAVRFVALMLELPDVPASPETRDRISRSVNQIISDIGAGAPLSGEADRPWPGRFEYALPVHATRYSLWGLLWIPVLLMGAVHLLRRLAPNRREEGLTAVSALTLLSVPLLLAVLLGTRWMASSDVPSRFLAGPFAMALPIGLALIAPRLSTSKFSQALLALLLAYAAYQPMRVVAYDAVEAFADSPLPAAVNEPFEEVVDSLLPPGSRVLLVGDQDARDYSLFSPETGYSNTVIPWGSQRFDPERMDKLIASERVTHVLIQHDVRTSFLWFPPLDTSEMVRWFSAEPALTPVSLQTPNMRLYKVVGHTALYERAFDTLALPAAAPLIEVDRGLKNQVGMDRGVLTVPWDIENLGGAEGGFLWVGQGYDEGLSFALWSRQDLDVVVRFNVSPGPGLLTPGRRVMVLHDGVPVGGERGVAGTASILLRTRLHAGRNTISLLALDAATVNPQPNGDKRNLLVGLHEVRVEPVVRPGDAGGRPQAQVNPSFQDSDEALRQSAREAVGLIVRRQLPDGYWLTAYTNGTRFEMPNREMNTYLTALMVDLLGSKTDPEDLVGSLARARSHLNRQIEASGLVRYHGKPGGRAMTENSMCAITPDADDTALAWRIAPGAGALLPSALATLAQYRTSEGLYKTWLASPGRYQCLNPGADPNPVDVGIQMHVLLWLARVDPPAAGALCSALRQTIDQERLWVYYRKAPLVPVLRQPELKNAGCELPLPSARLQSDIPGQAVWLNMTHMLARLQDGSEGAPSRKQVLQVLRDLSKDGFATVRENPPMLYHNDLSASVSRFYWSEDVGYALWLRLYMESRKLRP